MLYQTHYDSPVGELVIAGDGEQIVGLWMRGQKYFYGTLSEQPVENDTIPVLHTAKQWLDRYFAGEQPDSAELPLAPNGSAFRQSVWRSLRAIPYGQTTTYGEIAKALAAEQGVERMSAQAVGGAVAHNPLCIFIPCHRVVGTNGSLTGYAGGLKKKIWLLQHEGVDTSRFFVPRKGTAL